jgi:hypothetical protein
MARRVSVLLIGAAAVVALTAEMEAQDAPSRLVVTVSGGIQSAGPGLSDHFELERNVETAIVDIRYPARPGVLVDGGVGLRVWKNLGVGFAVSRTTGEGAADVDAKIPHPLQFQQPRTVIGEQSGVTHEETGVHAQVQFSIPATRRLILVLSAGPSRLSVEQELVTDVLYDEEYPFDIATFRSATTRASKASVTGFNAGADLRWMLGRHMGFGGMVRFIRGSVDLTTDNDRRIRVRAGGVQAGGGIRVAF